MRDWVRGTKFERTDSERERGRERNEESERVRAREVSLTLARTFSVVQSNKHGIIHLVLVTFSHPTSVDYFSLLQP